MPATSKKRMAQIQLAATEMKLRLVDTTLMLGKFSLQMLAIDSNKNLLERAKFENPTALT